MRLVLSKLTSRDEWLFFALLPRAHAGLAIAWWILLVGRGALPASFAVAMGVLVGAVQNEVDILLPLALVGSLFVLVQVLSPIHLAVSSNLGSQTSAFLNDHLTATCLEPPGIAHLEDPAATHDLTMARDFDLGISGPPLSVSMDFIAVGLVEMVAGVMAAALLFGYAWWPPFLLGGAWLATHYLLRESSVWRDRQTESVRMAQRHADYAYRVAVEPPAAKEIRLFGLGGWIVDRFRHHRRRLYDLRWEATRLREKPVVWSLLLVTAANVVVFSAMAIDAAAGTLLLDRMVIYSVAAMTTSMIAFGGLSWALDGAAAPAGAVARLRKTMADVGGLSTGHVVTTAQPVREIRFRNVTFGYPTTTESILNGFELTIPAGSSLALVGPNGAGKTTLAKLLCRLYDPQAGAIEVDGTDLRDLELASWRAGVTAVFQDYMRLHLSLRANVSPAGTASDAMIQRALRHAGATDLADLDTVLNKAYPQGTDLSGGQWQRVALARALCAVYEGARVVLLDEPTAQLDARGEIEIFERLLHEASDVTTILISHRFSTVRKADRICVLEHGRIGEMGTHDELMARQGRYHDMFSLQASRFEDVDTLDEHYDRLD